MRFQCQSRQGKHFQTDNWQREFTQTSNDNGVRVVNFATSKNLKVKSTSSNIVTFINLIGRLLMAKPTIGTANLEVT
jgi:hypothetical protein